MSRKDYIQMANALKEIKDKKLREKLADNFCQIAQRDNNLFSRFRFMQACELREE